MLRFLSDHVNVLPLGVVARLLHTHDVLLSLVPLVENPPWSRRRNGKLEKFSDQRWLFVAPGDGMLLTKLEGQVWLTLYNLLMDKSCRKQYQYNTHRKDVIIRVRTTLQCRGGRNLCLAVGIRCGGKAHSLIAVSIDCLFVFLFVCLFVFFVCFFCLFFFLPVASFFS